MGSVPARAPSPSTEAPNVALRKARGTPGQAAWHAGVASSAWGQGRCRAVCPKRSRGMRPTAPRGAAGGTRDRIKRPGPAGIGGLSAVGSQAGRGIQREWPALCRSRHAEGERISGAHLSDGVSQSAEAKRARRFSGGGTPGWGI